MPTNRHDNIEVADLPPTASEMTTDSNNNNQVGGLFQTMFSIMVFDATLEYLRKFPKSLRKVIEFVLLLQVNFYFILNDDVYNLCSLILGCLIICCTRVSTHTFFTNGSQLFRPC